MNSLFAVGASHAFYLAFLILKRSGKKLSDKLLCTLFLGYACTFSLFFVAFEREIPELTILLLNINLLLVPLLYLYTRSLTRAERKLKRKDMLFYMPYIITSLFWIILFLTTNEYELIQLFSPESIWKKPLLFTTMVLIDLLALPLFIGILLVQLEKHEKQIRTNYSYTEGIDFAWIRFLILIMLLEWFVTYIMPLLLGQSVHNNESIRISTALSTIFIFIIGYFGMKQGYLIVPNSDESSATESKEAPQKSALLNESETEYYVDKLEALMQSSKPYLNSTLSLQELAELSAMSRNILSFVINEKLGKNFYDYINGYRVEAFKARVKEPETQNFTLLSIALECGFNSKATFNRIFKKSTGQTPNQFVKSLQE